MGLMRDRKLEDEYAKISAQMNTALKSGNDNEYRTKNHIKQNIRII